MKWSYSTDLSDTEWECLEPHVPPPNERGRPRVHTTRQILDAILGYKMAELVAEGTVSDLLRDEIDLGRFTRERDPNKPHDTIALPFPKK